LLLRVYDLRQCDNQHITISITFQGACFYHLGKYVEAIECYDKALNTVHYEKPLHIRVLDLSEREEYLE
jgi:tetratricopeptide (TPR) repeat protein